MEPSSREVGHIVDTRERDAVDEIGDLITRSAQGDGRAYGEVVRRFQDMAVGYAYSLLRDFQLAEDAAQEAFVHAYGDLGSLRDPAAFPGWSAASCSSSVTGPGGVDARRRCRWTSR